MNNGNYNSQNFPYTGQDYTEFNNINAMDSLYDDQEYVHNDQANIAYQTGNMYEYQPENTYGYDYNNISEYQRDLTVENAYQEYQSDGQSYKDRNVYPQGNMSGSQQNISTRTRVSRSYQTQPGVISPIHEYNGFAASSDSSYTSQTSQKTQPQSLPEVQEPSNQVNGILQTEDSVEPNGPILGGQGYIPVQTVQKAYYELGETPEIKAACLRGLRQQIEIHQEENNFDEHSDAFLLKFLRSRKFDVEAAYTLLEKYYNVRESKPEVFRNLTRKNVKRTMEQGIVGVLPQRDKKGRAIVTFNFSGWNMSLAFHFERLLRVFVFTFEKLFESEETQINGIVIICNLAQLSVLQTKNLGAAMITKVLEIFEGNLPFRLNAIHLLNPPWHFKLLWKMVDPLTKIKPKIARRIYIHDGDLSRFQAEFEPELLPKELGGKCPPYDNTLWVKELLNPDQAQQTTQQATLQQPSSSSSRRSPSPARRGMNR